METERQYNTPIFKDEEPELEITWEKYQLIDSDPEERMETREMLGEGNNGRQYSGIGYYFCGELDGKVEDIEIIPW